MESKYENEILERYTRFKDYYNYLCNFAKKSDFDIKWYFQLSQNESEKYLQHKLDFSRLSISLLLSIDFVKIFYDYSIHSSHSAKSIIYSSFINVAPVKKSKNFLRGTILHDGVEYTIFFVIVMTGGYYKGLSIRIVHPDKVIIEIIENLFGQNYSISSVEYTADMSCPKPLKLLKIVASTMTQKYARSGIDKNYQTTYYCSNPRKALTLGSYVYFKSLDEKEFVRIECRYKRKYFNDKNISRMKTACIIDPLEIFSRIDFKIFNLKKFLKKYLKVHHDPSVDDISKALGFELYFFKYFYERHGGGVLGVKKLIAQDVGNQHYYFEDYPFGEHFKSLLNGKCFL